jgi:hypothetical protein
MTEYEKILLIATELGWEENKSPDVKGFRIPDTRDTLSFFVRSHAPMKSLEYLIGQEREEIPRYLIKPHSFMLIPSPELDKEKGFVEAGIMIDECYAVPFLKKRMELGI